MLWHVNQNKKKQQENNTMEYEHYQTNPMVFFLGMHLIEYAFGFVELCFGGLVHNEFIWCICPYVLRLLEASLELQ